MERNRITRRNFIKSMAFGTCSLLLLPQCSVHAISDWRFFTNEEAELVDAIVEQIIPTDEWLGAKDAGVTNYIDKQLVGPLSRFQEKYKKGLKAFKITCQEIHKTPFEKLAWDEQTKFLTRLEKGDFSTLTSNAADEKGLVWEEGEDTFFFMLIRNSAMQGYYGSPRHGGNYKYVSYKMIGLDYPVIQGQNRYNKKS